MSVKGLQTVGAVYVWLPLVVLHVYDNGRTAVATCVNDVVYPAMTPEKAREMLKEIREKEDAVS